MHWCVRVKLGTRTGVPVGIVWELWEESAFPTPLTHHAQGEGQFRLDASSPVAYIARYFSLSIGVGCVYY